VVELSVVRPCEGGSGIEVMPKERLALDIRTYAAALKGRGLQVVDAHVLLVVKDEPRTTLWPTGRMIVQTRSGDAARARALEVLRWVGVEV
jgi:hypothetical protein